MPEIKMISSKMASGKPLEAGKRYDEEVSDTDKAVLVRMGAAEYVSEDDNSDITVKEIKEHLETLGVEFDAKAKKAELLELLNEATDNQ